MEVTHEMMAAQDKRIADSIADVSIGIDALRAENRKLRAAEHRAACGFLRRAACGQALPRQWTTFALYLATNHKEG